LSNDVVLIVDDSKFIAQAYSRVLLALGYRVLIACDRKTGLFAAESCNPSIILLDMLMSDMDGVDVLRTLKQTQSTTDIPVLIISSLSEKNGEKLIQEGAAGQSFASRAEALEAGLRLGQQKIDSDYGPAY
jgi:PleD family two-component response regulator